MKKVKNLSDLPEWFDISKYDKVSSLGLEEWYVQIDRRFHVQVAVDVKLSNPEHTQLDYEIDSWLLGIKNDPIFKGPDPAVLDFIRNVDGEAAISDTVKKSVRDFTVGDLRSVNTAIELNSLNKELIDYCKNGASNEIPMDFKTMINLSNTSVQSLSGVNLWIEPSAMPFTVNIYASDEQLDQDFKSWVKQARESFNCRATEEMFTDKDFKAWCKYAILPYFDLTTWARLNHSKIAQAVLAKAIFPKADLIGFDEISMLRKESRPRAAEIFNLNTWNAMRAQVQKR